MLEVLTHLQAATSRLRSACSLGIVPAAVTAMKRAERRILE